MGEQNFSHLCELHFVVNIDNLAAYKKIKCLKKFLLSEQLH